MKNLIRLIEVAHRKGIVGTKPGLSQFSEEFNVKDYHTFKPDGIVLKAMREVNPFVFVGKLDDIKYNDLYLSGDEIGPVFDDGLDAPFRSFSIETLGSHLGMIATVDGGSVKVKCILCIENEPKVFLFLNLCEFEDGTDIVFAGNGDGPVVKHYLKRMNTEKMGLCKVKEKVKIGTGENKEFVTIRKIVYVRPKKVSDDERIEGESRSIDWTHRWLVRGHWVSIPGRLGKDRDGNYCVRIS